MPDYMGAAWQKIKALLQKKPRSMQGFIYGQLLLLAVQLHVFNIGIDIFAHDVKDDTASERSFGASVIDIAMQVSAARL
jgi:hypothetical protein